MHDAIRRTIPAADGTKISWYRHPGPDAGPCRSAPLVLTNGLSTTDNFWQPLVRRVRSSHEVVHWDYRGHGKSESARSRDYAIRTHADDLARVTEAACRGEGAPRFSEVTGAYHVGFSVGVMVVLELYRRRPELVRGMVLIAGGAEHPWAGPIAARSRRARGAFQRGMAAFGAVMPVVQPLVQPLIDLAGHSKATFGAAQAVGALGRAAPREELEHYFRTVSAMDRHAFWGTVSSLFMSTAADMLHEVRVPVLVIAPESDMLALRHDLTALHAGIPGAEWATFPGTSHAVLLEAGELVSDRILQFLGTHQTESSFAA